MKHHRTIELTIYKNGELKTLEGKILYYEPTTQQIKLSLDQENDIYYLDLGMVVDAIIL